jgi:O-acetyl-ADP-ribose deacetylase (regulator of RNase III)
MKPHIKPNYTSFYEQAISDILSQPISEAEATLVKIKKMDWQSYCQNHQIERRLHYREKNVKDLDGVKQEAFFQTSIKTRENKSLDVILWSGFIQSIEADAVVNAANESLLGGGGVDYAIHQAAGPLLLRECATIKGGCEVGEVKITKGYDLPAPYVIHTVGPILTYDGKTNPEALSNCYLNSLKLCDVYHLKSVVFPPISCGFYGYPIQEASEVVLKAVEEYAKTVKEGFIRTIIFTLPEQVQRDAYLRTFSNIKGL